MVWGAGSYGAWLYARVYRPKKTPNPKICSDRVTVFSPVHKYLRYTLPHQVGSALLVASNWALFVLLNYMMQWRFIMVSHYLDLSYYVLHHGCVSLLCFGSKKSWGNYFLLPMFASTPLFYLYVPHTMALTYVSIIPSGIMLGVRLFRTFHDLRMLLIPIFLVGLHTGMSCLMLFTNSVIFLVLRDVVGTCAGCGLLALVVWTLPASIEWVDDDELTDLRCAQIPDPKL